MVAAWLSLSKAIEPGIMTIEKADPRRNKGIKSFKPLPDNQDNTDSRAVTKRESGVTGNPLTCRRAPICLADAAFLSAVRLPKPLGGAIVCECSHRRNPEG